jgi:hypothetical protein
VHVSGSSAGVPGDAGAVDGAFAGEGDGGAVVATLEAVLLGDRGADPTVTTQAVSATLRTAAPTTVDDSGRRERRPAGIRV